MARMPTYSASLSYAMRASVGMRRYRAFSRLALQELVDERRLLPDFFGEVAVDHDRAVRRDRHGLDDGRGGRAALVATSEGGGERPVSRTRRPFRRVRKRS